MNELRCKKCGSTLEKQGETYICPACRSSYEADSANSYTKELVRILDEQKQEAVANLRMQLWREFNKEYYDLEEIKRLSKGIKSYLPDDFFANFCDFASERNSRSLNKFLRDTDVVKYRDYVWDMLNFLMRPLREKNLLSVNGLLERIRKAELDRDKFNYYKELLIKKSKEIDEGVYVVTLPRDVFVAYRSADMAEVEELVETLEEQKISCFVAARNLQHGAIQNLQHGAIQHYEEELKKAMDSCKTVVFVSSSNSRNRDCDALTVELAYIKQKDKEAAPGNLRNNYEKMPIEYKKPRVEYLISKHKNTAWDRLVEEFFAGYEYCYSDANELATRISRYITEQPSVAKPQKENVKYCVACGAESKEIARFCLKCGGQEFVATKEECEERQRIKQERALREAEAVRKAEEEKKKVEEVTDRRKKNINSYRKAAKLGNASAQYNLGNCYYNGEGVDKDYKQAVFWYTKAAEQGNAFAQNNLGNCYYNGEGVDKDYKQAVCWYTKAAKLGNASAQYNVGNCYYNGEGVAQDYEKAVYWYNEAAKLGNARGQYNLGNCYYNGEGVAQDYEKAVYWYAKAAEQGHADAAKALKTLKRKTK